MVDTDKLKRKAISFGKSLSGIDSKSSKRRRRSSTEQRALTVKWKDEIGQWTVEGPTAGFGTFDTKKEAKAKAKNVYNTNDDYDTVRIKTRKGAISTKQSYGKQESTYKNYSENRNTGMGFGGLFGGGQQSEKTDDRGPQLPFMGQPRENEDRGQPEMPLMGGYDDGREPPTMPFMGESSDDGNSFFGPPRDDTDERPPFF